MNISEYVAYFESLRQPQIHFRSLDVQAPVASTDQRVQRLTRGEKRLGITLIALGSLAGPIHAAIILTCDWIDKPQYKGPYCSAFFLSLVLGLALVVSGFMTLTKNLGCVAVFFGILACIFYAVELFVCFLVVAITGLVLHGFEGIH